MEVDDLRLTWEQLMLGVQEKGVGSKFCDGLSVLLETYGSDMED